MSSDATSSPSRHISSAHDMGDSFELSTLQSLLEDAVNDYEKKVETSLIENQVAFRLRSCDTIESVTEVLEERAQAFRGFLGNDRHPKIMTSIRRIVHVLYTVLTGPGSTLGGGIVQVGHGISSVSVPPVKLIMSAIGILLTTVKDVNASYESLLELFESLGNFIQRLDIYTKIPPTTAMTRIVVKIIIELLSALALATKQIKEGQLKKFFMKGLGENELETALRKLDRLTQDEARSATAQTLGVVSLLEKNMRMVMGGETSQAIKGKREQMRRDLQRWLSPPDPWKNHNIACDAHHKGTATWFIQGDTFSKWKASGSLLWICGKPGAGKTTLCSTIIEAIDGIRRSGLASLGFFYCDFRDDEKRNRRGLLSSLLIQLCDQSKFYAEIIYNLYSEHRDGSQDPSDAALAQCLKDVIRCVGKPPIYIILDALDECPNAHGTPSPRGKVLMLVEDLVSLHIPNLRICITSRPETDIETTLDRLKFHPVSLHDEEGQIQDIENYIISVVNSDARMGKWRADDKELVVGTLSRKANGMFRWVSCQIDFLRRCLPARIRRALDELPETLNETYERTLEDIDEANWEYAHRLFQCITVASRPFCVEEFAEFLVFDFEAGQIPTLVEDWRPEDPIRAVLSTCSSLITIVEDSQEVQFSHFSVKEFLISSRLAAQVPRISRYHILMTPAHTTVAHACLSALLHLDENISEDSLKDFPLAQYAAEHWMDHAQLDRDNVPLSVKAGIRLLFDPRKPHFTVWMWIFNPDSPPLWQRPVRPSQPPETPLHFAALYGICDVAEFLIIECAQDVNSRRRSDNRTPLFIACEQGHAEVTRLLLRRGADFNSQDDTNSTPLDLALKFRRLEVAEALLKYGADVNSHDNLNRTWLHLASEWGYMDIAQFLLNHSADAKYCDKDGTAPLHLASQGGHAEVVRLLLSRGADPDTRGKGDQTALHLALRITIRHSDSSITHEGWKRERLKVAEALLECGANANLLDQSGQTPLHLASELGYLDFTQLLLNHGADAKYCDKDGTTSLHLASQEGHVEVARLLLSRGADPDTRGKDDQTALHLALRNARRDCFSQEGWGRERLKFAAVLLRCGNADLLDWSSWMPLHPLHLVSPQYLDASQRLLARVADAKYCGKDGTTPLDLVSQAGYVKVVRFLGADPDTRLEDDQTDMRCALQNARRGNVFSIMQEGWEREHLKVAEALLECGANANLLDQSGQTPLHLASEYGYLDVAQRLLARGADAQAQDGDNTTPLYLASQNGHPRVVQLLLSCGADPDTHCKDDQTALHMSVKNAPHLSCITCSFSHVKVAEALLDRSADPNAHDKNDQTPLHLASEYGCPNVAQLLLNHGADVNAQDKDNRTPLYLASQNGHPVVVQLLISCGADLDTRGKDNQTILHLALRNARRYVTLSLSHMSHMEVAKALLKSSADVNARDKNGQAPLHLASEQGHLSFAQQLLDNGADAKAQDNDNTTPLHRASQNGRVKVVQLLLNCSADANASDKNSRTPLHLASEYGYSDVAQLLLDHGVYANATDKNNTTALHLASQNGHLKIVQLLLSCGAVPDAPEKDGQTALHLALNAHRNVTFSLSHMRVAETLLECGAGCTARDESNLTPLHLASKQGYLKVIALLLARGADVKAQDKSNSTPLHLASQNGRVKAVQLLASSCGADANVRDRNNRTPLHLASEKGYVNVARLLLDLGADVEARDKDNATPLQLASIKGHVKIIQLLGRDTDAFSPGSDDRTE